MRPLLLYCIVSWMDYDENARAKGPGAMLMRWGYTLTVPPTVGEKIR
jgi:hypothetical protein